MFDKKKQISFDIQYNERGQSRGVSIANESNPFLRRPFPRKVSRASFPEGISAEWETKKLARFQKWKIITLK